jgi:hypothetical protein
MTRIKARQERERDTFILLDKINDKFLLTKPKKSLASCVIIWLDLQSDFQKGKENSAENFKHRNVTRNLTKKENVNNDFFKKFLPVLLKSHSHLHYSAFEDIFWLSSITDTREVSKN